MMIGWVCQAPNIYILIWYLYYSIFDIARAWSSRPQRHLILLFFTSTVQTGRWQFYEEFNYCFPFRGHWQTAYSLAHRQQNVTADQHIFNERSQLKHRRSNTRRPAAACSHAVTLQPPPNTEHIDLSNVRVGVDHKIIFIPDFFYLT